MRSAELLPVFPTREVEDRYVQYLVDRRQGIREQIEKLMKEEHQLTRTVTLIKDRQKGGL